MAWYLKKQNGEIYGPVDLPTLQDWARDGRVAPQDQLSQDQKSWSPAPNLADLAMDWKVELRDGTLYGPLNLFALKELVEDGSVSRRARVVHKVSKEASVVSEALLTAVLAQNTKLQSHVEALVARLQQAEKKGPEPKAQGEREAPPSSPGGDAQVQRELKTVTAQRDDYRHKAEKWEGLYMDEQSRAGKREKELLDEIHGLKMAAAQKPPAPAEAKKPAANGPKPVDPKELALLRQEVDKWKKLYEQARTLVQTEQAKAQQVQQQSRGGDTVPRSVLEEAEHKLAQVERSYRQLLRTLNRNVSAGAHDQRLPPPDNFRRRDLS
ncbi:MAG: GYF domain-containing protein [Verrucomicrobiota bacterium]